MSVEENQAASDVLKPDEMVEAVILAINAPEHGFLWDSSQRLAIRGKKRR